MIASLLVCAGLLAQSPPAPTPDLAAYEVAKAHAGRDADTQVKLALWCEAHGRDAERLKHLARAVLIDPKNVAARGLMGLVAHGGRWESPEAVSQKVKDDEALAAKLAQYEARRDGVQREAARFLKGYPELHEKALRLADRLASARSASASRVSMSDAESRDHKRRVEKDLQHKQAAQAHVQLALWCEKNDLKPEAIAHFTEASQLYPTLITPWEHLGCKKHNGRWMTAEQIAAERREIEAQQHSDRYWEPLLRKWKLWLGEKARRDEAEGHLAKVADPRAVPSVWKVLITENAADQRQALRILERIDSPDVSPALVMLTVFGATDDLREHATKALFSRDSRDVVPGLIELIRSPLRCKFEPPSGYHDQMYSSRGTLVVEGKYSIIRRSYLGGTRDSYAAGTPLEILRSQIIRQSELADVQEIERLNKFAEQINPRVLRALGAVTGQTFPDNPDTWMKWWLEQEGYGYEPPKPEDKPTNYQNFLLPAPPPPPPPVVPHTACFAAGTLVQTLCGPQHIESLRLGDRVLSQDIRTGALSYQPVVNVHKNPPHETLRIRLTGEAIVATGIHRFWKAGHGWIMARDLKAGDLLRIVGGTARIETVEPNEVQPVYNLDVASNCNFFVGNAGLLVHDFSIVEAVPEPFDASPSFEAH